MVIDTRSLLNVETNGKIVKTVVVSYSTVQFILIKENLFL